MISKIIFSTSLLSILPLFLVAQSWHKLSGLSPNVTLKQIEVSDSGTEYVLSNNNFVFYSEDNGNSWLPVAPPQFASFTANARVLHINNNNGRVFLCTSLNGISYFDNAGANWGQEFFSTNLTTGLHESIGNIDSSDNLIVVSGNFSFGGGTKRYLYSTTNGDTWSDAVLVNRLAEYILIDRSSNWLVASNIGLQKSTDFGASWSA